MSTSTRHCQLVNSVNIRFVILSCGTSAGFASKIAFYQCLTARFHYQKVISKILQVQLSLSERDRGSDRNSVAYVLFECSIYPFFLGQTTSYCGLMNVVLLIFPKLIDLLLN